VSPFVYGEYVCSLYRRHFYPTGRFVDRSMTIGLRLAPTVFRDRTCLA